jgi:LCP family protein required for cell wall assembly
VQPEDQAYRVYKSGGKRGSGAAEGPQLLSGPDDRPYRTYRSAPRGLRARLRGADDIELGLAEQARPQRPLGGAGGRRRFGGGGRRFGRGGLPGRWSWKRGVALVVGLIAFWLLLSLVLFFISSSVHGSLPAGAESQLSSGGPMLTSANNVLLLGLDNRPTSGADSKEGGGANTSERNANTDTIMLWRIGGGVSRRLSIPRDTLVNIPGLGMSKINAAWSFGGPALTLKVIKQFTGLQINHLIVIDLANFPNFINDVGGVTIKTDRVCSSISGGTANGGFTLDLRPGVHHLNGEQAMVLARTRENSCNPAENDITREKRQQQILNAIKSQLFSFHTFLHLPWVAWDAPGVVQTDMGGLSMLQMFVASELGGSAPVGLLKETPETLASGADVLVPNSANVHAAVRKFLNG